MEAHLEQIAETENIRSEKLAYTVGEFGEVTGLGRSYLYLQMKAGLLPSVRAGKRRLILREDGVAWLTSLPTT